MSQTILITGANRGIGFAIAQALLEDGHVVLAGARHPDDAAELCALEKSHPETLQILELDVASDASVAAAAGRVKEIRPNGIDVLINNAGAFPEEGDENFAELELSFFEEAFRINVIGVARMIRMSSFFSGAIRVTPRGMSWSASRSFRRRI